MEPEARRVLVDRLVGARREPEPARGLGHRLPCPIGVDLAPRPAEPGGERLHPTRLGAKPRNTAATRRVESAVKLPRSNSSEIAVSRTATPIAQAVSEASPASSKVRSINRKASRIRDRLRSRAISGNSELEIGLTRNASGTPMQRML